MVGSTKLEVDLQANIDEVLGLCLDKLRIDHTLAQQTLLDVAGILDGVVDACVVGRGNDYQHKIWLLACYVSYLGRDIRLWIAQVSIGLTNAWLIVALQADFLKRLSEGSETLFERLWTLKHFST